MQHWIDTLIAAGKFGRNPPHDLVYAIFIFVLSAVVFLGVAFPFAGIVSWVERRVWARIQSRVGPNRVGPNGSLQWLADGAKHVFKEDVIPDEADARLFKLAPYVVVLGYVLPWAVMPFSSTLIIADLNVGILYFTAITALTVVGVLMAGWASDNKWSLIGGIRSAAQIISYEIPAGMSIFPVVLMTGTLSMQGIIQAQEWEPQHWFVFANPFTFIAANVLFVSALAEGNRTPFDLPEAESELVAGFATEYSGMRYTFFFMAEWVNLYWIGAIATTLFLGAWRIPWALDDAPVLRAVLELATFFAKAYTVGVLLPIWLRWTLPRIRVDQMMTMCWKYLVPLAFVNLLGTAAWMVAFPAGVPAVRAALVVLVAVLALAFLWRVRFHVRNARLTRRHLSFNPLSTARVPW